MLVTIINLINILVFRIFFHLFIVGLNITLIYPPFTESLSSSQRPNENFLEVHLCGFKYRRKISVASSSCFQGYQISLQQSQYSCFCFFYIKFLLSQSVFQNQNAQLDLTLGSRKLGLFCFPFTAQSLMWIATTPYCDYVEIFHQKVNFEYQLLNLMQPHLRPKLRELPTLNGI